MRAADLNTPPNALSYEMRKYKRIIQTSVVAVLSILTTGCAVSDQFRSVEGMIWNTVYHVTYCGPAELTDSIIPVLKVVDNSVSAFNENSTVSRINKNSLNRADSTFKLILEESKEVNLATDGYFDPSLKPAIDAWGFGKDHQATSDTARLDSIRTFVGINKISIDSEGKVHKEDRRLQLNFSAIAKGFGADEVGRMFSRNGVDNYMVEIGGETVLHGTNPSDSLWNIAIEMPSTDAAAQAQPAIILSCTDCGIATSGNYRNYRAEKGTRFGHTLDPNTCRPALTDVVSATVVASSSMVADAFATAFMAMGSTKAQVIAERLRLSVFLILADNSYWKSTEFKKLSHRKI